jgi:hypothetical protein
MTMVLHLASVSADGSSKAALTSNPAALLSQAAPQLVCWAMMIASQFPIHCGTRLRTGHVVRHWRQHGGIHSDLRHRPPPSVLATEYKKTRNDQHDGSPAASMKCRSYAREVIWRTPVAASDAEGESEGGVAGVTATVPCGLGASWC